MSLETLPPELLMHLPEHLHSLEDLYSPVLYLPAHYTTHAETLPPKLSLVLLQTLESSSDPHPHLLIAFHSPPARRLGSYLRRPSVSARARHPRRRRKTSGTRPRGRRAVHGRHPQDSPLQERRNKPINRRLDLAAGPASQSNDFLTVCNDPETALLSWVIYGELFHHSHELTYLPFPHHKPLSSIIRYKWFVYCMPDVNSFHYQRFPKGEIPRFFHDMPNEEDRFQHGAVGWKPPPLYEAILAEDRKLFVSAAKHMGLKSLELVIDGGVERLAADLEQVSKGIRQRRLENEAHKSTGKVSLGKHLGQAIGDPWLLSPFIMLSSDLKFTLWHNLPTDDESDDDELDLPEDFNQTRAITTHPKSAAEGQFRLRIGYIFNRVVAHHRSAALESLQSLHNFSFNIFSDL
ncbi:hypothetical protein R3P38DRAFT_184756 [Favolaschia claudopus]|uniref:Uncharacterized protein n=1 Tax=Favolaschia claudopus TaxID=2862362 RepID=A0AAW0CYI3_9AGAR